MIRRYVVMGLICIGSLVVIVKKGISLFIMPIFEKGTPVSEIQDPTVSEVQDPAVSGNQKPTVFEEQEPTIVEVREPTESFTCQGKIRCSEMSSCSEAMFYLKNCPNIQIDGDGDGIPCEDQFCGH